MSRDRALDRLRYLHCACIKFTASMSIQATSRSVPTSRSVLQQTCCGYTKMSNEIIANVIREDKKLTNYLLMSCIGQATWIQKRSKEHILHRQDGVCRQNSGFKLCAQFFFTGRELFCIGSLSRTAKSVEDAFSKPIHGMRRRTCAWRIADMQAAFQRTKHPGSKSNCSEDEMVLYFLV